MKKLALLIGVEDYRDALISPLRFARADVIGLADGLRERCAFDDVRVLAGEGPDDAPDLLNIVTALRDLAGELRPDDTFLLFFAGHGVEKDGHGYLLTRDSSQAFPEHGSLSLELLRKNLESLSAGRRVLMVDACRNCPDAGRSDADNRMGDAISRDIVAAARSQPPSAMTTAFLAACRSGQRAYEWPAKGHGVFTYYLLQGLAGPAWTPEGLEFRRLAGYAAKEVRQWAVNTPGISLPQEPWYEEFGDPEPIMLAVAGAAPQTIVVPPAPACVPRRTARPPRTTRRRRSPTRSATRCWSARRTCSAGGAWRSSTTTRRCATTSGGPPTSPRTTRCWSTGSSTTPSRSTSTRSATPTVRSTSVG